MLTSPRTPRPLTLAIAKALRWLDMNEHRAITVREDPDCEDTTVSPETSWDDLETDGEVYYLRRANLAVMLSMEGVLYVMEKVLGEPTGGPASEDKEAQKEEQTQAPNPQAPSPPVSLS